MKSDLGVIITNPAIRRAVYGTYVILLVIAGAVQAALVSISAVQPEWLTAALAGLVYLGIPVAGLAAANSVSTPRPVQVVAVQDPPALPSVEVVEAAVEPPVETSLCNSPNCPAAGPHLAH